MHTILYFLVFSAFVTLTERIARELDGKGEVTGTAALTVRL